MKKITKYLSNERKIYISDYNNISRRIKEYYILVIYADRYLLTTSGLNNIIEKLIKTGAFWVICVGPKAEKLHDMFDNIFLQVEKKLPLIQQQHFITTWELNDLKDAVEESILNAWTPEYKMTDSNTIIFAGPKKFQDKINKIFKTIRIEDYFN